MQDGRADGGSAGRVVSVGRHSSEAEIADVQRRLARLGYDVGESAADGVFGEKTLAAVRDFRRERGLGEGDTVDALTWAALVDASFELGERTLYLRMPYFHGADVGELQRALGTLGFSCGANDSIFGAFTEKAVREFQQNMGIEPDGIVGPATCKAIARLRWAYRDKSPMEIETGNMGFSRAAEVLEREPVCIYGVDAVTREIASRMSNLAFATTSLTKLSSAELLSSAPAGGTLLIEIDPHDGPEPDGVPVVVFADAKELAARLRIAFESIADAGARRVVVKVSIPDIPAGDEPARRAAIQHNAILILDAICLALA